jgi:exopolysaccharide production protein ExoQ
MMVGQNRYVSEATEADWEFARLPAVDIDGAFAFALIAPLLFIVQLGTLGALIFTVVTLGYAALRVRDIPTMLRGRWFLLLLPLYMLLSFTWSDIPAETVKHAIEFLITVFAGILIAASPNPRASLLGICAAFAIYTVTSLAAGNEVQLGTTTQTALSGLTDSKNEEADIAASGFIVSMALGFMALRERRKLMLLLVSVVAALQLYAAAAAHSTGAIYGAGVAALTFVGLLVLRATGPSVRATFAAVAGVLASSAAFIFIVFNTEVLHWVSTTFNKDTTLTGRTYLWDRARDLITERPLLGRGFGAFWQQGNLDAEGLWQFGHIDTRSGFNFHSTIYDILVTMGWVGLTLFALTLLVGMAATTVGYVRKPTLLASFWVTLGVYTIMRMPVESIGMYEYYFSTVLLFALLGSAFARVERRALDIDPYPAEWTEPMPASADPNAL